MDAESVKKLQYQSALRKARRPALNWFQVFGIVIGVFLGSVFVLGFGPISFVIGGIAFFISDRYNRRKARERLIEVRTRFGQIES